MADGSATCTTRRLARLGARLSAHGMDVTLTRRGLRVISPHARCACGRPLADTITYRPNPDAAGAWWFFTSWGRPIGPRDAEDMMVRRVLEYLVPPHRGVAVRDLDPLAATC